MSATAFVSGADASGGGDSSASTTTVPLALLIAASLLLLAAAAIPPWVLPQSRVGTLIQQHRTDLLTVGATGVVCLLFAVLITRIG